jgi:glyoxylase-like metal-dependent hydrolase (beta-lactamase superfamily II)
MLKLWGGRNKERGVEMEQLKVGAYTLTWLNGGVTNLDGGAMFGVVPKPLWSKKYPCNENNQIELRTDPILIQGNGLTLLLEAGIGNGKLTDKQKRNYGVQEESNLVEDLARCGLKTSDIDHVLMTHLHFDHATGLSKLEGETLVPTFENATIWATDVEWQEMQHPNIRSRNTYWEENWKPIVGQVKTFSEKLMLSDGLTLIHTGGHSDGHAILSLESEGETLLHMADLMPTHAHHNVLWVLAYDDYPMTSVFEKERWLPQAIEAGAWFSFYHDAFYRAVKLDPKGTILEAVKRERN